jgi:GxxExxY protein
MLLYQEKTEKIIRCFYNVYNELGYGFLEKVYERAFEIELKKNGFSCFRQTPVAVFYHNELVGSYFADIVIDGKIILEIKAGAGEIQTAHEKQLSNYLKATELELGFIFHFGEKPTFKKIIFNNDYK